jgi:hypothetical protein
MKDRILHLITEFTMVFLSVLLAFFISSWAEQKKEEKYQATILDHLRDDVKKDSANIIDAIEVVGVQHDSLTILLNDLYVMNHKKANGNIYCTYFSYNVFEPTTSTYQSMLFSGDMKLIDIRKLKSIKDVEEVNLKLRDLHVRYQSNIELFRNTFISQYNVERFNFAAVPSDKGIEFWNRLNFLSANVKYYYEALLIAQMKYNNLLADLKVR